MEEFLDQREKYTRKRGAKMRIQRQTKMGDFLGN